MIVIVFQSDNILNFPVLIMNIWGVHMSPKYWNEPEKFNPRRFLSEDGKTVLTPPTLIPFGLGESFQTFKALVSKCFILQSRNHKQLGTFSVNGERVCGGLFAVSGEVRTHRSRTRSAESVRPLRVILDSVGYH